MLLNLLRSAIRRKNKEQVILLRKVLLKANPREEQELISMARDMPKNRNRKICLNTPASSQRSGESYQIKTK